MNSKKTFTNATGAAVPDNTNIMTAGSPLGACHDHLVAIL